MKQSQTFQGALVALIILSLIFLVVERVVGRGRNRIQPIIRKGWFTDVVYWFATILVTKPLAKLIFIVPAGILVLSQVTTVEFLKLRQYYGFGPVGAQPLWLQVIEVYVMGDFISYWVHRLFHNGKWWPFHAVHHSSEDLDWLGSLRVHPVNDLVTNFCQAMPLVLLGFNPFVAASSAGFFTFYAIFLHANVNWDFGPLRYVIATPAFHRWHHSKDREAWDKNFAGLLPMWDLMFGTFYMPKNRYPENFGICEPMPKGYLGQMWEPFAWLHRRSKKVNPVAGQ